MSDISAVEAQIRAAERRVAEQRDAVDRSDTKKTQDKERSRLELLEKELGNLRFELKDRQSRK